MLLRPAEKDEAHVTMTQFAIEDGFTARIDKCAPLIRISRGNETEAELVTITPRFHLYNIFCGSTAPSGNHSGFALLPPTARPFNWS